MFNFNPLFQSAPVQGDSLNIKKKKQVKNPQSFLCGFSFISKYLKFLLLQILWSDFVVIMYFKNVLF